jgi:hypothetical protein
MIITGYKYDTELDAQVARKSTYINNFLQKKLDFSKETNKL